MVTKQNREIKALQDLLFKKERELNDLIISQGASALRHPQLVNGSADRQLNNHEKDIGKTITLHQNNASTSPNKPKSPLRLKRSSQESRDDPPKKQIKTVTVPAPQINQKQPGSKTEKNSLCPLCNEKSYGLMVSCSLGHLNCVENMLLLRASISFCLHSPQFSQ
jgi:hypothetical protein